MERLYYDKNRPTVTKSPFSHLARSKFSSRSKQHLVETRLSDATGSSIDTEKSRAELLEQLRLLEKENLDLKQQVIALKASQFYQINEARLKQIITQKESLETQVGALKAEIQNVRVQNQFLQSSNRSLRNQCQRLNRQILELKDLSLKINPEKHSRKKETKEQEGSLSRSQSRKKEFMEWKRDKQKQSYEQDEYQLRLSGLKSYGTDPLLQECRSARATRNLYF